MIQQLQFGSTHLRLTHDDDRPYMIAGPRMYAIGMMSGAVPIVGDQGHLDGEMGGLWALPIKVLDSWGLSVDGCNLMVAEFNGYFQKIERVRMNGGLRVSEVELIDADEPVMLVTARVANESNVPVTLNLVYSAKPHLRPCWMSQMIDGVDEVGFSADGLHAVDAANPAWAVVVLADAPLRREVSLRPGECATMRVVIAGTSTAGLDGARTLAARALNAFDPRVQRQSDVYAALASQADRVGTHLTTQNKQDPWGGYGCALANIQLLETINLAGKYPMAGLPEFPNCFGCDVAYSVPGLCAAGRVDLAVAALRALREVTLRQGGRVPHEVLPDGTVFHPGNTQEIPQFVIAVHAVWQHLKHSNTEAPPVTAAVWAAENFSACRAALLDYLKIEDVDPASQYPWYPDGDAMVERDGMLPIKLDSVCYTWRALQCFGDMARAMSFDPTGPVTKTVVQAAIEACSDWASHIERDFEQDWWMPEHGLYADSLGWDGTQRLDYHWTQVIPLEVGLARPDRAASVLAVLATGWLNKHGLPHTLNIEDRVWTLPTGLLALVAARSGDDALARRLLANIASTLLNGQLGLFEELIPRGLCFVQLWSAALYVQISDIVSGLA